MIMPHLSAITAILRTWQHPCLPSILDRRSRLQNRANCADEYQHEGHVLTPYPTTALYERMAQQGRLLHSNWDVYDTRHVVYRPAKLTSEALEAGYWRAYRDFYRWSSIFQGAWTKEKWDERLRHVGYAAGWKKFEPMWDLIIRLTSSPG